MKVVFAFDSFKGTLSAGEASEIAADAAKTAGTEAIRLPLADGGEGTTETLMHTLGGTIISKTTQGPLPNSSVNAFFGWCETRQLAVVEMAAASGLTLLTDNERNPMLTTTYGAGELLLHAACKKPARILLGVGGSATVDGGTGAARACGWRFLDKNGDDVPDGGGSLHRISTIVRPDKQQLPPIDVLCDVTNPLTGPNGAARIFGPQKGADSNMVSMLEDGLCHLAAIVKSHLGIDIDRIPGGGAAGGLAAGAIAWMNARLVPGIDCILDAVRFNDICRNADWIVTGEGRLDRQSLDGKVVSGILKRVQQLNPALRTAVIAGSIDLPQEQLASAGICYADAITPNDMPFEKAREHARELMRDAVIRFTSACQ